MKAISLNPNESVAIGRLAKPLATKAAELLTSQRLSIVLGVVAFIAIMLYQATGERPVLMAVLTLCWALQMCLCLTRDIKKGGEL